MAKAQLVIGGLILGGSAIGYNYYRSYESCDESWIRQDPDAVRKSLNSEWKRKVFGQDLALKVIRNSLIDHLKRVATGKSKKPLVLSFHGGLGTGKTFVGELLANLLYEKGENSTFVRRLHLIEMLSHVKTVAEKRDIIKNEIKTMVHLCSQSLIIFEEIDKLEEGVIDILFSYFDQQHSVDNIDFKKAIFIFSSNIGAREISYETCKQFNKTKQRDEFDAEQFYNILRKVNYNGQSNQSSSPGGFTISKLIKHYLVSSFVPFLPLEMNHILQCMNASLAERDDIMEIVKCKPELIKKFYFLISSKISVVNPSGCSRSFSVNGCKRVSDVIGQEADSFFFPD